MSASIKAVFFDLDDTLYDELTFVHGGFRAVAETVAQRFGLDARQVCECLHKALQQHGRGKIFDVVCSDLGIGTPGLVPELVDVYRTHVPGIAFFSDAVATLKSLRAQGMRLGAITDGLHTVQKNKVAALGLEALVDFVIYTDELGPGRGKPHPAAFQKALQNARVKPDEAAYIGNDPSKDFGGPNALGMWSVHFCQRAGASCTCDARLHVARLSEIPELIAGVTA